ncbi:MAG: hypothetical protein R3F34_13565 [Planctomycetota bacterium]
MHRPNGRGREARPPRTHASSAPVAGALAAFALLATAANAQVSELSLDGELALQLAPGDAATAELLGPPTTFAAMALDVDPGPVPFLGQSLPLGVTPALTLFAFNGTDASGLATWPLVAPSSSSFVGSVFYFAGLVADVTEPSGLRLSNGVSLEIVDRPPLLAADLAGRRLGGDPSFSAVDVVQQNDRIYVALDAMKYPFAAGKEADVYVVAAKDAAEWATDPSLVDVTSDGPNTFTFTFDVLSQNVLAVEPSASPGANGDQMASAFDVVVDLDRDGMLGDGDVIDGKGDEVGLWITAVTGNPGPYAVTELLYDGGSTWLKEDIYYPSNVAALGQLPLVVVSHGNGHNYQWYDHVGQHLASWGFVVVSHSNNTQPGPQSAATSTLQNVDHFLGNLATIAGGALNGHVDTHRIGLLGHSRGGEGVVIAYHRLFTGAYQPTNFTRSDVRIVSSIAPTYFEVSSPSPDVIHDVPYHVWVGGADADVTGCGSTFVAQPMAHYGWAEGERSLIQVQGAGHGAFHDGGGSTVSAGPCLLSRAQVHRIMKPHLLALFGYYLRDEAAGRDFLVREFSDLRPLGTPSTSCAVVHVAHTDGPDPSDLVIDDFQSASALTIASSGATVAWSVDDLSEGVLIDNSNFTDNGTQAFNSFTHGSSTGPPQGAIFSFGTASSQTYRYELPLADKDATKYRHLAFMLAQSSRHPLTVALDAKIEFEVRVEDWSGNSRTLPIGSYGDGIGEAYARSGCGTGTGWAAEFESFTIRIEDFARDTSLVDLTDLRYVEFLFGSDHGSAQGRVAIDQVELTRK